jgi:HSP20 family protein
MEVISMALIPYEPFRHLENIRREFDHFLDNDIPAIKTTISERFGGPRIDLYETGKEVVVSFELPGLEKKEDVNIEIDNNVLTISGTINRMSETEEERIHRQERFFGRFQKSVSLPANVSPEGVKATYKNGVLDVRLPKKESENRRKIDIEFH